MDDGRKRVMTVRERLTLRRFAEKVAQEEADPVAARRRVAEFSWRMFRRSRMLRSRIAQVRRVAREFCRNVANHPG